MPAHSDSVAVRTLPAWSWGLVPAMLVCLAAPAFFVVRVPWLGWALLAAGLVGALLVRRTDAGGPAGAVGRSVSPETPGAGIRNPSLLRDLSLIAVGLLIVSAIPLAAKLDDFAFVRFGLALGGAVVVPYVDLALGVSRPRHRVPLARWGPVDEVPVVVARRGAHPRLADPAVLLHLHRGVPELAGGQHSGAHRAPLRRRRQRRHLGRAVLHLHGVRAAAAPLPVLAVQHPAVDRLRLVPVGTRLPGLGAAPHHPVRAAAGRSSS